MAEKTETQLRAELDKLAQKFGEDARKIMTELQHGKKAVGK